MGFRDKGYSYFSPLHDSVNMQFNSDNWIKALKFYEKEQYRKSFFEILRYADKKVKKNQVLENVFRIPHGSVFIDIDFSGEEIKIDSDFLDISEANKIPLFRRITELNFSGLNLAQVRCEDNKLKFYFSCPLELYDPYKIFDVLAEICYFADKYDEEFCEQFGSKNVVQTQIKEIPDNKKEKIYNNFVQIINGNLEIIEDLENRRRNNYAWDVISTTYKMIDYSCAPKGSLSLRISEKVAELYSREISLESIIFRGKEFLKELSEMPKEEFFKNIYEAKEFIPHKKVANSEMISEYLRPGFADAYQDLQAGDFESSYIIFMHILYNSLYYHIMPYGMEKAIAKAIKSSSSIPVNKNSVSSTSYTISEIINLQNIPSSSSGFWFIIGAFFMWLLSFIFGN